MGKTLVITEKRSVADDFARVLGGPKGPVVLRIERPAKAAGSAPGVRDVLIDRPQAFEFKDLYYESDDLVIAWASGHLLELQQPGDYDKAWSFWRLDKLPIIPEHFVHTPRDSEKKGSNKKLLPNLVKLIRRDDVDLIVNGCDAGREGELIFNLILDHAQSGRGKQKAEKLVVRLWLQSMTADSIRTSFRTMKPADLFQPLRDAAYTRDQADWLVGMNGTRALTKRFLGGRNAQSLAVGRVKTPTLAFLVDREREIDSFIPVPYWEISASFTVDPAHPEVEKNVYQARWSGKNEEGKNSDRILDQKVAEAILAKVTDGMGTAVDTIRRSKEKPPQLFDLTTLQRRASSSFGFTLRRTLSIAQTLYEAKKAITYPRTSSRYLPEDYRAEVPRILESLSMQGYAELVAQVPNRDQPKPETKGMVFDDKKVSDHFALIPTGERPDKLKPDEKKIYDMIVRRFLAAFMSSAERESVTRVTTVEEETFKSTCRKLVVPGWRGVETIGADDDPFPELAQDGVVATKDADLIEKHTTPPSRYTDGTLVGEMETCGKHVESEEEAEALKEIGIGTPATRASIVEDLIFKRLARRDRRTLVPTSLGSTLVRLVRNLDLESLAKPDMTGMWERRLRQITEGSYDAQAFQAEIRRLVEDLVTTVKSATDVGDVYTADHPAGLGCPKCGKPLTEKAYSYYCTDQEECQLRIHKDAGGKHVFPEVLKRLLDARLAGADPVGPFTGFERPKAPCKMRMTDEGLIALEPEGDIDFDQPELKAEEQVADGTVMGSCPMPDCKGEITSQGAGYVCTHRERGKGCKFRLSKKLLFRELPPAEVKKVLSAPAAETSLIEGFISRRGRPFAAHLFFDEKGSLKWKFPERPKKAGAKKATTKKKAAKKKATTKKTAAKKKTTTKKVAPKKD